MVLKTNSQLALAESLARLRLIAAGDAISTVYPAPAQFRADLTALLKVAPNVK